MNDHPVACSLDARYLKERLAWIAGLNAKSLKSSRRDGRTIILDYDHGAIDDVCKMVAGERECCPFLQFEIKVERDAVRLSILAPQEGAEAADALFDAFATRAPAEVRPCGCVRECGA